MTPEHKALAKLAKEYRPTMDKEVLHSWASDVVESLSAQGEAEAEPVAWQWREHYNKNRDDRWHLETVLPKFSYDVEARPLYTHPAPAPVPDAVEALLKEARDELDNWVSILNVSEDQDEDVQDAYGLIDRIDTALASNMPVGDGWRSMDSAPRDGAHIIIAVPTKDQDDYIVGEAYFDPEHYEGGDWWWAGTDYDDYHSGPLSEVNHHPPEFWQPLPRTPIVETDHVD